MLRSPVETWHVFVSERPMEPASRQQTERSSTPEGVCPLPVTTSPRVTKTHVSIPSAPQKWNRTVRVCVWPLSLNVNVFRNHLCGCKSFVLIAGPYSTVWICLSPFIPSPTDGHLGTFSSGAVYKAGLLWTLLCMSFGEHLSALLSSRDLLLDRMVNAYLTLLAFASFPKCLPHSASLPATCESFSWTASSALGIFHLFHCSRPSGCMVVPRGGFNLRWWSMVLTPLHVYWPFGMFFCEMLLKSLYFFCLLALLSFFS